MSPPLPAWHDVSIGIGVLSRDRAAAIRTFLSATVINLTSALLGAVLTMVPALDWLSFGAIVGVAGILGLGYALHVVLGFHQHSGTVLSDWFWYAVVPLVGYALLLAVAATAFSGAAASVALFAAALALMLVAGIRNAWDMIVFLVTRDRATS